MQSAITILIVSGAILYLGYEFYARFFRKKGKCDSCGLKSEQNNPPK